MTTPTWPHSDPATRKLAGLSPVEAEHLYACPVCRNEVSTKDAPHTAKLIRDNGDLANAAPDLLAALVELTAAEDSSIEQFTAKEIDRITAAMKMARAAIAKAKGAA